MVDSSFEGLRAYIWVNNNKIGDETSEWFLVTGDTGDTDSTDNNWLVPEFDDGGIGFTLFWRLSTANTPVWGGLNNVASDAGIQNVDPGTFEMQTFLVPEPSAGVLSLFAGLLLMRRRR